MSDEGWVRLGDCEPGTLVETADGKVGYPTEPHHPTYSVVSWLPTSGERFESPGTPVRPLTAVRLHPSLRGSDLPGLCAAALADPNEGTYGRLLDWLGDALGRDPDVAAAVREQAAKVAEIYAVQAFDSRDAERYGSPPWVLESGRQRAASVIADRIRALGRPAATAATAAACGRCGGRRDWHDALTGGGRCYDCGGTGGATGEGV